MISYYTSLLLLTLLLQASKHAVLRNLVTLMLVVTSDKIIESYLHYGYSFYGSVVICEIIYFVFLLFTINLHKSRVLFAVTLASLTWNLLYLTTDYEEIKDFIYNNYSLFNLILFECLLISCANTTRVSITLKKYLNGIKNKSTIYKKVVKLC